MPSWVLCASRRGLSFRKKLRPFRRTRRAMPELRILDLPAAPFEAGYHHGREAADLIAHNLGVYFDRFQREARLSPNEVRGRARRYLPVIEAADPAYADAMRGAVEGSRLSLDDLAVLNARYELIYSQYSAINQENAAHVPAGGCTAFAVTPEASADGHLWLGQNWDWFPQVRGLVLRAQHPGGFTVAAFTEAGIVGGKIGMNSAGLGLVINGLLSHRDDWRRGGAPACSTRRGCDPSCATMPVIPTRSAGIRIRRCPRKSGSRPLSLFSRISPRGGCTSPAAHRA